jgi:hypothetical protein
MTETTDNGIMVVVKFPTGGNPRSEMTETTDNGIMVVDRNPIFLKNRISLAVL